MLRAAEEVAATALTTEALRRKDLIKELMVSIVVVDMDEEKSDETTVEAISNSKLPPSELRETAELKAHSRHSQFQNASPSSS